MTPVRDMPANMQVTAKQKRHSGVRAAGIAVLFLFKNERAGRKELSAIDLSVRSSAQIRIKMRKMRKIYVRNYWVYR